ncbi:MAG: 16S rRNA (uracil(1498)-N(3))-methyltransferase [bacterium]|jgi:16S rRNA (uracil1498-N3)-methyltransferase|nr:16S rRNA (uracil(1498)-N(3))-methyltransferase [candidate division KSB1 bacterium]MDH7559014.1 16S rRNA (uracil(1498)-N(3))-methyltransferase [bacterium]
MHTPSHADFFYVRPQDVHKDRLFLVDQERHHLVVVHRTRLGHRFFAVDGLGHCYECELAGTQAERAEARIVRRMQGVGEPRLRLTLAASPLRGERFDLLVEKGTELGVSKFVLLCTARSGRFVENRIDRWRRVALAAMKQCGRSMLPEITGPCTLPQAMDALSGAPLRLLAHEGAGCEPLVSVLLGLKGRNISEAALLVGPEGGFTAEEVASAVARGFTAVSLGSRRLRAETAAVLAAALVLAICDQR